LKIRGIFFNKSPKEKFRRLSYRQRTNAFIISFGDKDHHAAKIKKHNWHGNEKLKAIGTSTLLKKLKLPIIL